MNRPTPKLAHTFLPVVTGSLLSLLLLVTVSDAYTAASRVGSDFDHSADAVPGQLTIFNFGKEIPVQRTGEGELLLEGRVYATNRNVIARTSMSKTDLLQAYPGSFTSVAQIASFDTLTLYRLELSPTVDPVSFAHGMHVDERIDYAQPDLLPLDHAAALAKSPRSRQLHEQQLPSVINGLWKTTKGEGVRLAIIDDGFDLSHPELQHIRPVFSYDADLQISNVLPKTALDTHGTRVAGLIHSVHDGKGVEGIAPEAELVAVRQTDGWTSHLVLGLAVAGLAGADIINCSWTISFLPQPVADVLHWLTTNGREGKGALIVVSAGNHGRPVSEHNGLAALPNVLTVGALDSDKQTIAAFSNHGEELDLLAPTDLTSIAGDGHFHRFGGTSAAAALVSGTAALLLARNPALSRVDLQKSLGEIFTGAGGERYE